MIDQKYPEQNKGNGLPADAHPDRMELRRQAEKKARALEQQDMAAFTPEEFRWVLHELQVHQIELEMQNEEMRRAQEELDASRTRYFELYDLAPVGYCTLSEQGLIREANLTAATLLGVDQGGLVKQPITRFIVKEDQDIYYRHRKLLFESREPQVCELRMQCYDGRHFWARLQATVVQGDDGAPLCRLVISDITESKQAAEALQKAFDQIKTLRGIIPICAHCKNIRNDKGYWSKVEVYVSEHTEALFSHGICPACMKKLYPQYEDDDDENTP